MSEHLLPRPPRYNGVDPVTFDRIALSYIVQRTAPVIEESLGMSRARTSEFPWMARLEEDALDVELIYRQCALCVMLSLQRSRPLTRLANFVYLYLHVQTLILNNIDTHLDLSDSYAREGATSLSRDVRNVLCFAPYSILSSIARVEESSHEDLGAALRAMSRVTQHVIACNHDDYAERYSQTYLSNPGLLLDLYDHEIRSRHLGSGFFSSSVEAADAFFGDSTSSSWLGILRDLRRLRQRVDELTDIIDDLATGHITYPWHWRWRWTGAAAEI